MKQAYSVNNRRGGFYFIDGQAYASVTNILKAIDKPALRYWFGREVYRAFAKDPKLSEQDALSAPYKSSKKAAGRGSAVHDIIEAHKRGHEVTQTTPELQPYVNAFFEFAKSNGLRAIDNERTVFSKNHKFAGTLDMYASLNGSDKRIVLDIKTNKDGNIYDEAHLQVSAYKHALQEMGERVDGMAVLGLSEKGTFTFKTIEDCFDTFLATKKLWEFQNRELINKMTS